MTATIETGNRGKSFFSGSHANASLKGAKVTKHEPPPPVKEGSGSLYMSQQMTGQRELTDAEKVKELERRLMIAVQALSYYIQEYVEVPVGNFKAAMKLTPDPSVARAALEQLGLSQQPQPPLGAEPSKEIKPFS